MLVVLQCPNCGRTVPSEVDLFEASAPLCVCGTPLLGPRTAPPPTVADGVARLRQGHLGEAIGIFSEVIRSEPRNGEALFLRASARGSAGDVDGALADYADAIAGDNARYVELALVDRAGLSLRLGAYDQVVADCDRAIMLDPADKKAYLNRAVARLSLGDPGRATADCNEALRLDPEYALAYMNRGCAAEAEGLRERRSLRGVLGRIVGREPAAIDRAKADWRRALALAPAGWHLREDVEGWLRRYS